MIALVPVHEALAIADVPQRGFEVARVMRARGRQHGFAEGDAIEGVVAQDEFFRPARPADQRVALVARAAQRGGDEIDALRNRRKGLRRRDQARHARFAGNRGPGAKRQSRAAGDELQKAAAADRCLNHDLIQPWPHVPFIPAQAGIQGRKSRYSPLWVPAFAGTNG